jgi:hypothetical protein
MTETSRRLLLLIGRARAEANHGAAAAMYFQASTIASDRLGDPVLSGTLLHLSLIEQLITHGPKDRPTVRRIIANLETLAANPVDDRLQDRVEPLIRYFRTIEAYSTVDSAEAVSVARAIAAETSTPSHYLDALSSVLARLFLLLMEEPRSHFEDPVQDLIEDLERWQLSLPMPQPTASIFDATSSCLQSIRCASHGETAVFTESLRTLETLMFDTISPCSVLAAPIVRGYLLDGVRSHLETVAPDALPLLTNLHGNSVGDALGE